MAAALGMLAIILLLSAAFMVSAYYTDRRNTLLGKLQYAKQIMGFYEAEIEELRCEIVALRRGLGEKKFHCKECDGETTYPAYFPDESLCCDNPCCPQDPSGAARFTVVPRESCWHPMKGSAEYLREEPFRVELPEDTGVAYMQVMWDTAKNQPVLCLGTRCKDKNYCEAIRYQCGGSLVDLGVFRFDFDARPRVAVRA